MPGKRQRYVPGEIRLDQLAALQAAALQFLEEGIGPEHRVQAGRVRHQLRLHGQGIRLRHRPESAGRIPVTVLTGFLGSGKTTLLNRLLRQPDLHGMAVIVPPARACAGRCFTRG